MERYHVLEPYLKNLKSVRADSKSAKIPNRTLYNWINRYKNDGLAGLIDKMRKDKHQIKIDKDTINFVQNEYFNNRGISIASIYRKTKQCCNNKRLPEPSYYQVYNIIKRIHENLKAYSNMKSKKYAEKYDGIYTREGQRPNEIWQADHTMLDIEVLNERLSRYPQLYSCIGFNHQFEKLNNDELKHVLEYRWDELSLPLSYEDFEDYESINTIIKITNGNFRVVQRLFSRIIIIMEINELYKINVEVIETARDGLLIGENE